MAAKKISFELSTLQMGIFYLYRADVTYLKEKSEDKLTINEKKWKSLQEGYDASASNIGLSKVLVPALFEYFNANYKISIADSTDIDNGIIQKTDLLKIFFDSNKKGLTPIFFKPVKLLNKFLTLFKLDKIYTFDDSFFMNPFPNGLTLSIPLLRNILSNVSDFNPAMFFSSLYESMGVFFYQDIPTDIFKTKRDNKDKTKIHAFNLRTINALPIIDNDGVIGLNDSIDFSKVKKMASYSMGEEGNISPYNPWTEGQNFDQLSLKSMIFKLDSNYSSQSLALGSASVYSINAPLLNFYKKTKASYKLDDKDDEDNQDKKELSGKGNGKNNDNKKDSGTKNKNSGTINIIDIFAPENSNKNIQDQFNGEFILMQTLIGIASIKNVFNFIATNLSFIDKIGHCQVTNIEQDSDNPIKVQKFDMTNNKYIDMGELELPSGNYFILNTHIKQFISSEGKPIYITNAQVVKIEEVSKFLISKTKEKDLIDKLKKAYKKIKDSKKKKSSNSKKDSTGSVATNSEYLYIVDEDYNSKNDIDSSLLENVLNECIASDTVYIDSSSGEGGPDKGPNKGGPNKSGLGTGILGTGTS